MYVTGFILARDSYQRQNFSEYYAEPCLVQSGASCPLCLIYFSIKVPRTEDPSGCTENRFYAIFACGVPICVSVTCVCPEISSDQFRSDQETSRINEIIREQNNSQLLVILTNRNY
jgi:hypothetical protein